MVHVGLEGRKGVFGEHELQVSDHVDANERDDDEKEGDGTAHFPNDGEDCAKKYGASFRTKDSGVVCVRRSSHQ